MKKRRVYGLIFLAMILAVGCGGKSHETTGEETTQEMTSAEEQTAEAQTPLPTEEDLGIAHPIRFASEMKIISDKSYFDIEAYEMPTKIDGKDVAPGEPLTKTRIITYLFQPYDAHDSSVPQYDGVISVGYYDLVRGEYVEMAGEDVLSQSDNPVRVSIFPVDEEYCVYGEATDDQLTYALYRIADGTKKQFETFALGVDQWRMSPPYTAGGKLYLPELAEDGFNIHIYDAKTGEKLDRLEHVMEAYPWKDTEAYRKTETIDKGASDVLVFGDESRRWQNDEGKVLAHWGVDSDTNAIYAMSYDEETDRLMEDLTQEERNDADGFRPYFVLQNVTTDKTLAETRGDWLFADVSGPWIKVSRDGVPEKRSYILVPGENLVVRVSHAEDGEVLHLRGDAGYAVAMEIASRRLMQGEVNTYSIYVLTKHEDTHKN